ncbi:hypothetical protein NPS47_25195, partial [Pseudomonas putida]|nr:hypothetical protein [Pseudomonas putida]
NNFYDQFLDGNWVDPKQLGKLPGGPVYNLRPGDFTYTQKDQHRLWQVWIDSPTDNPILELEIKYPRDVRQRSDGRGYMFRLALEWSANEADRVNSTPGSELIEKDGIVLIHQSTELLKLAVPNSNGR